MIVAVVDAQTLVDALGLGAVYALMAVGIGLVFGVLRLVNFAYGQLIMAGAFTLAYASRANWSTWTSIVACFAVVIGLSLAMELAVFRPLRTQSPAVMLVATFAVSFLLQSVALLVVLKVQGQLGDARVDRRAALTGGDGLGRRRPQGDDRLAGRRAASRSACSRSCSAGRPSGCRCAPRRRTSRPRACSGSAPTASSASRCSWPACIAAVVAVLADRAHAATSRATSGCTT